MSPVLEKEGILGETSGRRPGDVTIPIWRGGKGLAVDVAVTSPFSVVGLRSASPADSYEHRKHRKYDVGFFGTGFEFCTLVLETTGGWCGRVRVSPAGRQQAERHALCLRWSGLGPFVVLPADIGCPFHLEPGVCV